MIEKELEKIFKQKKQKTECKPNGKIVITPGFVNATVDEFLEWFKNSNFEKGCHYCGTTNEKSFELYQLQRTGKRHDATRGGKRSKRLELDRKDPSQPYDNLKNVVWCCYWCNNAKSNFFSQEEFEPIAKAIGEVIKAIG